MNISGALTFHLSPTDTALNIVSVHSTRPFATVQLMQGKPIQKALTTVPLLFSLCAKAQAVAAIRAIESAQNTPASQTVERRRELLVLLETLREHLWRFLLDWPRYCQQEPDTTLASHCIQLANSLMKQLEQHDNYLTQPGLTKALPLPRAIPQQLQQFVQLINQHILLSDADTFLTYNQADFSTWLTQNETHLTRLYAYLDKNQWLNIGVTETTALPVLPDKQLIQRLDSNETDQFIARPSWDGAGQYETGAYAREYQHPLICQLRQKYGQTLWVRLVARVIEIARIGSLLDNPLCNNALLFYEGGLGACEAARGRLYHRTTVEKGVIQYYRVLAPTEWNFHPQGAAAQALATIHLDDEISAQQQAHLCIHAIDPCVEHHVVLDTAVTPTSPSFTEDNHARNVIM